MNSGRNYKRERGIVLKHLFIGSFRKQLVEPEKMFELVSQRSQIQILLRHVFFYHSFLTTSEVA